MAPNFHLSPLSEILEGYEDLSSLPGYLRISLIDRCNEKCFFCHNEGVNFADNVLSSELIFKVAEASSKLKKFKIKFTGGEPTLVRHLPNITKHLKEIDERFSISVITNGVLLSKLAHVLAENGIERINVSLHSLDRKKYQEITGLDALPVVLNGLERAKECGFREIKLNREHYVIFN